MNKNKLAHNYIDVSFNHRILFFFLKQVKFFFVTSNELIHMHAKKEQNKMATFFFFACVCYT